MLGTGVFFHQAEGKVTFVCSGADKAETLTSRQARWKQTVGLLPAQATSGHALSWGQALQMTTWGCTGHPRPAASPWHPAQCCSQGPNAAAG